MKIEVNYIFYTCVYTVYPSGIFNYYVKLKETFIIHPSRAMLAWLPRPDMASLAECAHHQFGPCTLLAADARPRRTRRAHSLRLPAPHNRYRDGAAPPGASFGSLPIASLSATSLARSLAASWWVSGDGQCIETRRN